MNIMENLSMHQQIRLKGGTIHLLRSHDGLVKNQPFWWHYAASSQRSAGAATNRTLINVLPQQEPDNQSSGKGKNKVISNFYFR